MNRKIILALLLIIVSASLIFLTIYLITVRQSIRSQAANAPACPSGTQLLFSASTNLKVGETVALGGKIESISGNPKMENRDGVPLAQYVPTMKVTFPSNIILDSALIFDNDPKKGEKPWSINGVSLPASGQGKWGPLFNLNLTTNVMNFENGGDSSHINICVKESSRPTPSPEPSNTPTDTPTPSETPTPELTPTETPIPSVSPSPSVCPKPKAVTDIKISCEGCRKE